MPEPTVNQLLWLRVTNDGQTVRAYAQLTALGAQAPSSWSDTLHLVATTTDFSGHTGGQIGVMQMAHWINLDHFTLRTDRDDNGSYETTELVETFTADASGYVQQTPTHDAAGNLTYDGVYAYDAWNRQTRYNRMLWMTQ